MDNNIYEDSGYEMSHIIEKRNFDPGHRYRKWIFSTIIVLAMAVLGTTFIILTYTEYPEIQILYAGDEHIEIHEIKTNTFGKSRLSGKYIIEYNGIPETFESFEGRSAQIASEIMRVKPELVVVEKETVLQLAENQYLKDVLFYLEDTQGRDVITIEKYSVGSIRDINCGIKVKKGMIYKQIPYDGYLSVISGMLVSQEEENKFVVVADFAKKILTGEPYRINRRQIKKYL